MNKRLMRCLCILIAMMLLCAHFSGNAETDEWMISSDGKIEMQIISIEEDATHNYIMTYEVRVSGQPKFTELHYTIDQSEVADRIVRFGENNPSFRDRDIAIVPVGITQFSNEKGADYHVCVLTMIGNSIVYETGPILKINLNLTDVLAGATKWCLSEDDFVKARVVSFEENSPQNYQLKLELCLNNEENKKSFAVYELSYSDFSKSTNSFVRSNPNYKNRKLSFAPKEITRVEHNNETQYSVYVSMLVGSGSTWEVGEKRRLRMVLADEFPDEFIDNNAYYAAQCISAHKTELYNSNNFAISDVIYVKESMKYPGIVYVKYQITKQNKLGGMVTHDVIAEYDTNNEKYEIYEYEYEPSSGEPPKYANIKHNNSMFHAFEDVFYGASEINITGSGAVIFKQEVMPLVK